MPGTTTRKTVYTSTHWGAYQAEVENQRLKAIHPFVKDLDPSPIGQSLVDTLDDACRITRPMVRAGFLEHGPQRPCTKRGAEPFVAVDWEQALDLAGAAEDNIELPEFETFWQQGYDDGSVVRVFNERGACLAGVVVSDEIQPGVVALATGAWYDPLEPGVIGTLDKHGNANVLTPDKGTSKLAQAPIAHSTLVEVERFDSELPPVTAFTAPPIIVRQ